MSCQAPGVTLHDNHERRTLVVRPDIVLMADERQAVHYRYLAAEQVGAASRLAEEGDEAATMRMLHGAVEYLGIAEAAENRAAMRRIADGGETLTERTVTIPMGVDTRER